MMDARLIAIGIGFLVFFIVGAYWILTPQGFCSGSIWDCFIRQQPIRLAGIQLLGTYVTVILILIALAVFWLFRTLTKP